jgi:hypothetical protein
VTLHASGDAELEVWATGRHLQPFEELVGKPVRVEVVGASAPVQRTVKSQNHKRAASAFR